MNMENNKANEVYCNECDSCGEDGCCSHINCARVRLAECKYGDTYLKQIMFNDAFIKALFQDAKKVLGKEAQEYLDFLFDRVYNEIYK